LLEGLAMPNRPPIPPPLQAVADAFERLFVVDQDETFVIRAGQVSKAIAALLGVPWTWPLGQSVRAIAEAAGARPSRLTTSVYIGLRPKGMPRDQALQQAKEFRKAKQWKRTQQPAMLAAREALRIAREKKSDE
jgi:hypothetical protein